MFATSHYKRLFFYVACYENFAVNQKAGILVSYVIKEHAHAFSCAYIELWMYLGSLESTQEARLMLSAAPRATLTNLSCSPNFPIASIPRYTHTKHEQILNFHVDQKTPC